MPLFKSKVLLRRTRTILYKVLVKLVVVHGCGTWTTTKLKEKKLSVFERKINQRKIIKIIWKSQHSENY